MIDIVPGAVNQTIDVFIQDSSSTVGAGLTGLAYNSAGLVCYYRRGATGSATALSLATLATIGTAHADGGFKEIDATNMPGLYRLDLSDAIVAAGVDYATLMLKGATNMAPTILRINLEDKVAVTDILSDGVALNTTSGVLDEVTLSQDLGTTARADVNAEVLDVLATDTASEPTGVPAADASIKDKINWLFVLARNKMSENSDTDEQTLYADDGTTAIAVASVTPDSPTVTTRGKFTDAP